MGLKRNEAYSQVLEKACWSHDHGRNIEHIRQAEIELARLYAYGYRTQTIGLFHATHALVNDLISRKKEAQSDIDRRRAAEYLRQLANRAMDVIPSDFRAVVSTFYYYDRWAEAVVDAFEADFLSNRDSAIERIAQRFILGMEKITRSNGICTSSDSVMPEQSSLRVPDLGIDIVPLVYGDYHSWNFAYLGEGSRGVPAHLHHQGVEIHLGFGKMEGRTILGQHCALVHDGYAMPIPPMTVHGFDNLTGEKHILPFIFGSLALSGWGVFFDVEPCVSDSATLVEVLLESEHMNHSVHLDKSIAEAIRWSDTRRQVLIDASATGTPLTGGLELALAKIGIKGLQLTTKDFRAVSIRKGQAQVNIGPSRVQVGEQDHFGVPAGIDADISPIGSDPLITLDSRIVNTT